MSIESGEKAYIKIERIICKIKFAPQDNKSIKEAMKKKKNREKGTREQEPQRG